MAVIGESPWYQEIEQCGIRIGEERGRRENILSNIAMILEVKFGNEGIEFMPPINQISDLKRLQEILRGIVVANTVAEVRDLL
ncbi:MAG: hypothetical protein RM338_19225 [Nostoc sp. DedQUE12a]|nr:hypothetical protein [Nostoc sp. DedQUE12a]